MRVSLAMTAVLALAGCRFDTAGTPPSAPGPGDAGQRERWIRLPDGPPAESPVIPVDQRGLDTNPPPPDLRPLDKRPLDKRPLDKPPLDKPSVDKPPVKLDKGPPPACYSTYGSLGYGVCKDNGLSCDLNGFQLGITCTALCAKNNYGTCQAVYTEYGSECVRGSKVGCGTTLSDHICVCDKKW